MRSNTIQMPIRIFYRIPNLQSILYILLAINAPSHPTILQVIPLHLPLDPSRGQKRLLLFTQNSIPPFPSLPLNIPCRDMLNSAVVSNGSRCRDYIPSTKASGEASYLTLREDFEGRCHVRGVLSFDTFRP